MEKGTKILAQKRVRAAFGLLAAGVLATSLMIPARVHADEEETEAVKAEVSQESAVTFSTDYKRKPLEYRFAKLFATIQQTSVKTSKFTFD